MNKPRYLLGRAAIARYLGVSMRTVTRLKAKGLPVRSVDHNKMDALPEAIDAWLRLRQELAGREEEAA